MNSKVEQADTRKWRPTILEGVTKDWRRVALYRILKAMSFIIKTRSSFDASWLKLVSNDSLNSAFAIEDEDELSLEKMDLIVDLETSFGVDSLERAVAMIVTALPYIVLDPNEWDDPNIKANCTDMMMERIDMLLRDGLVDLGYSREVLPIVIGSPPE